MQAAVQTNDLAPEFRELKTAIAERINYSYGCPSMHAKQVPVEPSECKITGGKIHGNRLELTVEHPSQSPHLPGRLETDSVVIDLSAGTLDAPGPGSLKLNPGRLKQARAIAARLIGDAPDLSGVRFSR